MTELINLCITSEVEEGTPLAISLSGLPELLVCEFEGEFFVTDNTCTHGNAKLSEGYQEEDEIECPFHGGTFSIRTGEATSFPCVIPIKSYPVTIVDEKVCISHAQQPS
jgi:ethylbenzene dioxygenase ferredoxin subunit